MPSTSQNRFDTRQLTQNEENQGRYREQIKQETESSEYVAALQENKWEKLKDIIKCAAETHVGYKKKANNHQISDPNLERMSNEQKDIRLQIENYKDPEKNNHSRKSRKKILKEMNQKVRDGDAREKRAEDLVGEVENAKNDTRMFKAATTLHMKHQKIQFVPKIKKIKEVQKIKERHFMKHLNKENINHIKNFMTGAKKLNRKTTAKEVKTTV